MLGKTIKSLIITPSNLQKIVSSSIITHSIKNAKNLSLLRSNNFQTLTPKNIDNLKDVDTKVPNKDTPQIIDSLARGAYINKLYLQQRQIPTFEQQNSSTSKIQDQPENTSSTTQDQNDPSSSENPSTSEPQNPTSERWDPLVINRFRDLVVDFEHVDPSSEHDVFKTKLYHNISLCERMANVNNVSYKHSIKRYLSNEKENIDTYINTQEKEIEASILFTMIPVVATIFCCALDVTPILFLISGVGVIAMVNHVSKEIKRQRLAKINNEFIRTFMTMM